MIERNLEKCRTMKIKNSILTLLLFFTLVPVLVFGLFSIYETNQTIDEMAEKNLKAVSQNQIMNIQKFCGDRREEMEMVANYSLTQDAIRYSLGESDNPVNQEYVNNVLKERKKHGTYVASVSILDKNFHVVGSSENYDISEVSEMKYVDERFHTGDFIIGSVYERETDDGLKKIVPAYIGVFFNDNLIGYIAEELDTAYFDLLRLNMDSLAEATFYILDGNYAIITAGKKTQKESLSQFESSQKDREDFQKAWDAINHEENPQGEEVEDGRIDFNHVNFSYRKNSTEDTLHDIDIHINAGETIGIIGGTGCGKSSFVSLISRLYDVTEGSVCVGGKDVRTYDMDALRNQVAVVLQKNVLFSGTILDNLRWGDDNASYEDCVEACKQACADEFIERMPKKYDTWIEQGGTNVSGGQRQRLCIARALLKKPKVLILDDSTSAVDTATDAKIKQAFAQKIPGTTKLIVSQRISSIQDADRIIVLEDGKVSGFDTHENLMENNKVYREICEVQMQGGGDFDESAE